MLKIPDFILVSTTLSDRIFMIAYNFMRNILLLIMQNVPLFKEAPLKSEIYSLKIFLSFLVSIWQKRAYGCILFPTNHIYNLFTSAIDSQIIIVHCLWYSLIVSLPVIVFRFINLFISSKASLPRGLCLKIVFKIEGSTKTSTLKERLKQFWL